MPLDKSDSPGTARGGGRPSHNLVGAAWLVLSGLLLTVFLILAKQLSTSQDPLVLAFWRSAVGLLVMLPIILRSRGRVLRISRPRLVILRSLCGTAAFVCSMFAISDYFALPLSQFQAISFSRALFLTLLAAWILGERVGPWRWGALLVGFSGILIMVLPGLVLPGYDGAASGTSGFIIDGGTLLALASAVGFAGAIIMVKSLSATHSPVTLLIWANLLSSALLFPFLVTNFTIPQGSELVGLIAMSIAGLGAQYCYISAMSVGDASFLAPIDYLRLPMVALADWLIFKALPAYPVWIGTAVIISATLFITLREHGGGKRLPPKAPDAP